MRASKLPALVGAVLITSLAGCSIDHSSAAADLEGDLLRMPGVRSVEQAYEPGDVMLSGSLAVQVDMSPGATRRETLAVIDAAYDEFATTYRREAADLAVSRGGTEILLHTDHPRADIDDVLVVARFALDAPRPGEQVRADLVASNEDEYDPLISELRLSLGRGSSQDDVVPRVNALASAGGLPEGADFWVLSADGAGVGASRGLPTEEELSIWRELSSVRTAGTIRVEFGPYQLYSDLDEYGFANVTVHATPAPTKAQLAAMKATHMATLAERSEQYVYNVTVNGEDTIWLRRPTE